MNIRNEATPRDMSVLLATIAPAMAAMGKEATASVVAMTAAMAVHDAAIATFGSARVLTATSRNKDATAEEKAAYTILRNTAVVTVWGEAFTNKVNNGKDTKEDIGSPKKGMASNTRAYWQQQMGKVYGRITDRIAKALAANKPADPHAVKAPNRKAPIDTRAIAAMEAPMKAMATALAATSGKGEQIPAHVDGPAFLRLCELALLALSPIKAKQGLARIALAAYDAAILATPVTVKAKRVTAPLETRVTPTAIGLAIKTGQTVKVAKVSKTPKPTMQNASDLPLSDK